MSGVNSVRMLAKRAMQVDLDTDQAQILWLECRANLIQRGMRSTIKHVEACENGSIDAVEQGDLLTSFAQVLTGDQEWPCNNDSELFLSKLRKTIRTRGYLLE